MRKPVVNAVGMPRLSSELVPEAHKHTELAVRKKISSRQFRYMHSNNKSILGWEAETRMDGKERNMGEGLI